MYPVLIQAIVLASSGLISVGSITFVILLLLSEHGWRNGLGYALGYASAYTLIGAAAVLMGYRTAGAATAEGNLVQPILLMVLGSLLISLAMRNMRRPVAADVGPPRFFSIVDSITPPKAFGFGALVTILNVKNLALFLTATSVVILSDLSITEQLIITLMVVVVFCLSVIIPVVIYVSFPVRGDALLNSVEQFLKQHSRAIGIWAPLGFGLLFLGKGLADLP